MNRRRGRRRADLRRLTLGLLLPFALILAALPAAGGAATANRAIQAEDDEASYTDPTFGWSIAWDPETWTTAGSEPTPANEDGVAGNQVAIGGIDSIGLGGVIVGSHTSFGGDLAACVEGITPQSGDEFEISEVSEADLELPEAPADAERAISTARLSGGGFGFDGVIYVECRPLVEGEALLGIVWVLPWGAGYADVRPDFEALLAGLDVSEVHPAGEAAAEEDEEASEEPADEEASEDDEEADDGTESYTDPTYGWTIEWDPTVWVQFNETDGGYGFDGWQVDAGTVLIANETAYGDDIAACLAGETPPFDPAGLRGHTLAPPAAPADAANVLYLYTIDGVNDNVVYIECRPLLEGEALLSILWVLEDSTAYDAALPHFEQLVADLDVSEAHPAGEGPDEETSQGDGEPESFADPTHGWTIEWDPATWDHFTLDGLSGNDWAGNAFEATGIQFIGKDVDALGQVNIFGLTIYGDDAAACQEAWMLGEAQGVGTSEADLDLPSAPSDAEQGLQLISAGGPTEGLNYVECRPLVEGEAVVLVNWQLMDAAVYEDALPAFEELIAGLDLDGGDAANDASGEGDDEEASEDEAGFFTDPLYGWSIAWDPEQWEADGPSETLGEDDKPGTQMDFLGQDYEGMGYVKIASLPAVSLDPAACVEFLRPKTSDELVGDGASVDNLREPDLPLPEAPSDAVGRLFQFAPGDQMQYLECRPLVEGEAVLIIDWYLPEAAAYEGALPAFEEFISGLDLSEAHSA